MNGRLQLTREMGIGPSPLIAGHMPRRDGLGWHPRNHLSLPCTYKEDVSLLDRNIAPIVCRHQRCAEGPSH
jgi:hypothetical protein